MEENAKDQEKIVVSPEGAETTPEETTEKAAATTEDGGSAQVESVVAEPKRKKIIVIVIVLLLIIAAILAALKFCSPEEESYVALMPDIDANAQDITTREELENAMQEFADANYFTLQVNPEAEFISSTGEGTFEIVNPSVNVYPISFELYLDDDNSLLYKSGAIMPNTQVRGITLEKKLDPGTYTGTARVAIYDPDDQAKVGETEAKITMNVT